MTNLKTAEVLTAVLAVLKRHMALPQIAAKVRARGTQNCAMCCCVVVAAPLPPIAASCRCFLTLLLARSPWARSRVLCLVAVFMTGRVCIDLHLHCPRLCVS